MPENLYVAERGRAAARRLARAWPGRSLHRHRLGAWACPRGSRVTCASAAAAGPGWSTGRSPGEERDRLSCPNCGFIAYINPRLVVTTIPVTDSGEIVLLRRGIEPALGSWAQPGGFLEVDETVAEGAIRETLEETGLIVEPGRDRGALLAARGGRRRRGVRGADRGRRVPANPEAPEIASFAPDRIPWSEVGLTTTSWALHDWMRMRHPEITVPVPWGASLLVGLDDRAQSE